MPSYWLASGVGEPDPLRVLAGTETSIGPEPTSPPSFSIPADAWVFSLSYSPDGSLLAVGFDMGGFVRVYNTGTWAVVSTFSNPGLDSYCVRFSPDGTKLAATYQNTDGANTLVVYNTSDWSVLTQKADTEGKYKDVAFSPDGTKLLAVIRNNATKRLAVFNTSDWSEVAGVSQPEVAGFDNFLVFSPDGSKLYTCVGTSNPVGILEYNTSNWTFTEVFALPWAPTVAVFLNASGTRLGFGGSGSISGEVGWVVYNTSNWTEDTAYSLGAQLTTPNTDVNHAAISSDYRVLALALNRSPKVYLVDTTTWSPISYTGPTIPDGEAFAFAFASAAPNSGAPAPTVVTTGTTGVVLDTTGAPAANRPIRVYDRTTGALITSTVTDAAGKFSTSAIGNPTEIQVVLLDTSTPALNDLIYRITL